MNPKISSAPATPAEAEEIAKKVVSDYLAACRATDRSQIGNYMMKLVSVTSVLMANAEGADATFDRLLGTAQFVLKNMPKEPSKLQ